MQPLAQSMPDTGPHRRYRKVQVRNKPLEHAEAPPQLQIWWWMIMLTQMLVHPEGVG